MTVTIVENDTATLSVMDVTADESAGYVEFTVTLSEASSNTVTGGLRDVGRPGRRARRLHGDERALTFTVPETSKTVRVPVIDDTVDEEEAETLALTLSTRGAGGVWRVAQRRWR